MNGDSSAADPDEKDYRGSEDGMVRAIRNTQRLSEEVMNATGCAVSNSMPKGQIASLGVSILEFLRKPIATCDFPAAGFAQTWKSP